MQNKTTIYIYVLIVIIIVYYITTRYIWCDEQENFDPSLVPVSSIVTLAKVAQKLVDGNGTLTNPGNLTVTGNLVTGGSLTFNGNPGKSWTLYNAKTAGGGLIPDCLQLFNYGTIGNSSGIQQALQIIPAATSNSNPSLNIWCNTTINDMLTVTGNLTTNGNNTCNRSFNTSVYASDLICKNAYGFTGIIDPVTGLIDTTKATNATTPFTVGYSGIRCGMYVWGDITTNGNNTCNKNYATYAYTNDLHSKNAYGYTGDPVHPTNVNSPFTVGYSGLRCGMSVYGNTNITADLVVGGNIIVTRTTSWDYTYKFIAAAINSGATLNGDPNNIVSGSWLSWSGSNDSLFLTGSNKAKWVCPTSGLWTISYYIEDGTYAHTGLVNLTQNVMIATGPITTTVPIYKNDQLLAGGLWNGGSYYIGYGFLYFKLIISFT